MGLGGRAHFLEELNKAATSTEDLLVDVFDVMGLDIGCRSSSRSGIGPGA